jgi:hypothetical protein
MRIKRVATSEKNIVPRSDMARSTGEKEIKETERNERPLLSWEHPQRKWFASTKKRRGSDDNQRRGGNRKGEKHRCHERNENVRY